MNVKLQRFHNCWFHNLLLSELLGEYLVMDVTVCSIYCHGKPMLVLLLAVVVFWRCIKLSGPTCLYFIKHRHCWFVCKYVSYVMYNIAYIIPIFHITCTPCKYTDLFYILYLFLVSIFGSECGERRFFPRPCWSSWYLVRACGAIPQVYVMMTYSLHLFSL